MIDKTPRITSVYSFANGMTIVFDQLGKQMPDLQGPSDEALPKIRETGFTKEIFYGTYEPRNEHG